MNEIPIEFQVQVWRDDEWRIATGAPTLDGAESKMLALMETGTTKARVVEVKAVITRKVVVKAANMGSTDDEIVDAVIEGRHL